MNNVFDAVADGNTVHKAKPDPEVFLKAAEMVGVEQGDVWFLKMLLQGLKLH